MREGRFEMHVPLSLQQQLWTQWQNLIIIPASDVIMVFVIVFFSIEYGHVHNVILYFGYEAVCFVAPNLAVWWMILLLSWYVVMVSICICQVWNAFVLQPTVDYLIQYLYVPNMEFIHSFTKCWFTLNTSTNHSWIFFMKMCYVWMCFSFFLVNECITFSVSCVMYFKYSYCRCVEYYIMWTVSPAFVSKWTIIRKCSSYSVILFAANCLLINCLCNVHICLDLIQYFYVPNTKCINSFTKYWFGHFQEVIAIRLLA